MAKVSNREDALLNAYLSRYKNAQASTVNEGQNKTQTARAKGAALLNATDKTLPVLKDTYSDTLQNIVQGASLENSLNNDVLNRQMKLAQAKFEQANNLYEQQKKAQQYAEKQAEKEAAAAAKAAAKAARSGRSRGKGSSKSKSGSSTDSASGEDAGAAMDALFGEDSAGSAASTADTARNKGGNYDPKRTNAERNASARARYDDSKQEKSDVKYRAQQKREQTVQMLKDKQAAANAGANKGKTAGKAYAEQKNAGNTFTKPSVNVQSTKDYLAADEKEHGIVSRAKEITDSISNSRVGNLLKGTAKQAMGAALSFLEAPAGGGSQANKAAQYEMRRLTETGQALNADGSVSDAYQKALDQFENTKNDQDVLDEKFVPALGLVKEGNAQVQRGGEGLNGVGKAAYNIAAMGANMAPGMALGLVNPALGAGYMGLTSAGQKLAEETEKGMGSRDALLRGAASGLISTGTNAVPIGEFANITKNGSPILQGALKEGVENAGQEAADYLLNTAADYALKDPDANFSLQDMASQVGMGAATGAAFGALGGVLNRAGNRAGLLDNGQQEEAFLRKDALSEETFAPDATNMEQSAVPQNVPAAIAQNSAAQERIAQQAADALPAQTAAETVQSVPTANATTDMPIAQQTAQNAAAPRNAGTAYMPDNTPVNYRWAAVDANDLVASNDALGSANPAYPKEYQNRNRDSAASMQQITRMANDLNPERLTDSANIGDGSPVVRGDNVVLSGNGRTAAIQTAYRDGKADNYRNYVMSHAAEYGIDPSTLPENPVLVRVADDNTDMLKLARGANESTTASFGAAENAVNYGQKVTASTAMSRYNPEKSITDPANNSAVAGLLRDIVPESEYNRMVTKDGKVSLDGYKTAKDAMFAAAYGNSDRLQILAEGGDDSSRNITAAMRDSAANAITLKQMVERGELPQEFDVTNDVSGAADLYAYVKSGTMGKGKTVADYVAGLTQGEDGKFYDGFDEAPYTPMSMYIAEIMEDNRRSGKLTTEFLDNLYASAKEGEGGELTLEGMTDARTRQSIIDDAVRGFYETPERSNNGKTAPNVPFAGEGWANPVGNHPANAAKVAEQVSNTAPLASAGGADALPMPARTDASEAVPGMDIVENARQTAGAASGQNTARPLNGSESVPENAVGAESTQYDRREVVNQDYANQRGMTSGLDEAHLKDLQTENTHQIWTDAEAKKQAEDDISTYIQQAGGDENKALNNAMQDLRNKEHWNKGDSATADEIRDRLKTQFAQTQPGTPEYYAQKARYEAWNQKRSQIRSETAQTMQSFHGDASERVVSVSKPITERWVKNNPVQDEKIKTLSDELAKLKDELRERDIADMEREAMQGVFENGSAAAKQSAGDMNAEFDQMLRDTGVISDTAKNDTTAEFNAITQRVKALCEKHRVNCTDEAAKDIAGRILNGDAAEQYYDKLIMQAAGITDLTPEEMELVDTLYSKAGTMPDSKARYDLEQQAIGIMAKHLPAKSWFERFDNIRYLAMLGNPTTHARNLIGNVLMKGLSDTKDEVAAAMQLVTTKKADRTKALYVPQDMKNAASKWIDENHYTDVLKDGGKFNLDSGLERARSTYGNSKAGRFVQGISDFNSDLLDKEDEIFVKLGATHSLANILTARGYDASIFTKTDEASQQALREALELAKQDAKDVTFHADTALTKAMNSISKAGDKNGTLGDKIAYCIGNGILPFAKTPANILKTAAEYNPVGATVEAMYRGATHKGSAAVTDALAKGVVGSSIMGVGYWLAHEGFLTGTLDEDTKDYDEMLGKQEYSVNIPGVGSYSIDWAAPAIVPLMMGANLEQSGYDLDTLMANPDNFAKMFGQASDIFVNALDPVTDMSMMQSLNNTLDNIRYNDESIGGSIGGLALDAGTSYLKQYMPTIASKAARTIDDTRRSSYGGGSSATERNTNYLLRSTLNKVPVLSKNNEPYIDQWGREEASLDGTDDTAGGMFLRGAYNFGSPGYYSAENVTPVDEYLQELYGSTNDSHVLPEKASSQIKVDGEGYYMTPKEKTEYAKTSGQTAYDIVDSLRQNDMFLQLPEDQQSALVQDAYSVAKTAGGVAAVGDGVSGTESNEYEAYKDGGVDGLVGFMLMKNATDLVRDEKRETSGNNNADLNTVETWNTLYSQFGEDAVDNFVNSTKEDSTVRNISNLAGDKAVTAYMQAYSAVAKTLDDDQTPDKFTVGYGMQKYGLSGDDFARAYLAAYYKKDKNGKYPEKGGSYADKAGAEIYQSYGADALQDWVNYRATIPDTNGNGKVDKDEAVARLKEMDLTNEMRRAYLAKTNKQWDKKNPF